MDFILAIACAIVGTVVTVIGLIAVVESKLLGEHFDREIALESFVFLIPGVLLLFVAIRLLFM